jgi:hypothetical protein
VESRSAVYRSATPEDAVEAYHLEAKKLATSGYVPTGERWSSESGRQVLTVEYAYIPDQAPAVLASLATVVVPEVDAQPRAAPPAAALSGAARPSIEPPVRVAPPRAAPSGAARTSTERPVRAAPPRAVPSGAARTSIERPIGTPTTTRRSNRLIPLAVVAAIVIAGYLGLSNGLFPSPETSSVPQADGGVLPPTGTIWFGSSFDTTSFALSGRADSLPFGKAVAFVAHLNRASTGEVVGLQLDIGGLPARWPGGQLASGAHLYGQVLPAVEIYQSGPLTVRVLDVAGHVLAIGTVTILP